MQEQIRRLPLLQLEALGEALLEFRGLHQTTEDSYTLSQLVSFLRPAINRRVTDNAP